MPAGKAQRGQCRPMYPRWWNGLSQADPPGRVILLLIARRGSAARTVDSQCPRTGGMACHGPIRPVVSSAADCPTGECHAGDGQPVFPRIGRTACRGPLPPVASPAADCPTGECHAGDGQLVSPALAAHSVPGLLSPVRVIAPALQRLSVLRGSGAQNLTSTVPVLRNRPVTGRSPLSRPLRSTTRRHRSAWAATSAVPALASHPVTGRSPAHVPRAPSPAIRRPETPRGQACCKFF